MSREPKVDVDWNAQFHLAPREWSGFMQVIDGRVHVHVQKVVTPELHAKFLQACDSIDVQGCSLPTFYK